MKNKKIDNIFFTADTHFGHSNIIKYCNRPFENVDEQDECIINNWNNTVKPTDTVYHLGDFAFGTQSFAKNIIRRLNGTIHFIAGNHDRVLDKNKDIRDMFATYNKYLEIKVDDPDMPKKYKQVISLFHFPIESWNKRHHGAWHLHGHTHGTFPSSKYQARVDVGVDVWNYAPVSYEEIKNHMSKKEFKIIDHHGKK